MARRLVQIEGDRRLSWIPVRDRELLIGRDADADVRVESGRASRRHALIEPHGDGHALSDLGSVNGTAVNGYPVSEPVLLTPGDVVEIGEERFLYEEAPDASLLRFAPWAGGALLAAGIAAALVFLWPSASDPLDEAAALAREAVAAHDAGDLRATKRALDGAVALLNSKGFLDDVAPQRMRSTALDRIGAQLDPPRDLLSIYESALVGRGRTVSAPEPVVSAGAPRRGPCRTDRVGAADLRLCVRERAEGILADLWQDPREVPEAFYEAVEYEFLRLGRNRRWVQASLARGEDLRPMMRSELEAANMPAMLQYLSMIESGYDRDITSHAGARGLWQFMPATARQYGLRVGGGVDERTDPIKSTRAAAQYLKDLAFEFGGDALLLAIASYNKGENGIRRALKKLDDPRTERSYWTLVQRGLIPEETQAYVPRLVAAAIMGEAGIPTESAIP